MRGEAPISLGIWMFKQMHVAITPLYPCPGAAPCPARPRRCLRFILARDLARADKAKKKSGALSARSLGKLSTNPNSSLAHEKFSYKASSPLSSLLLFFIISLVFLPYIEAPLLRLAEGYSELRLIKWISFRSRPR